VFPALAVLGIDAVDWLTHLANHRLTALWRLHAVHHSHQTTRQLPRANRNGPVMWLL
jgi:sterol desaturase/sphingolipid hydroxylase (fatty acid hydroxylase superfamily)